MSSPQHLGARLYPLAGSRPPPTRRALGNPHPEHDTKEPADMKFQDPPAPGRQNHQKFNSERAELKRNRGAWAVLVEATTSNHGNLRAHIKGGVGPWGPPGAYEATLRKRPDGLYDLYARYVGGAA